MKSSLSLTPQKISNRLWFIRGFASGILLYAAANALSWFVRSESWSDLLGTTEDAGIEAVGFPFEIWREYQHYRWGTVIDMPWVLVDLLIGLVLACGCGMLFIRFREQLDPLLQMPVEENANGESGLRRSFSLRGLFVATTLAAVCIAAVQALGLTSKLLLAIYLAGPIVLILIAMAPTGMPWKQRVVLLIVFAAVMLGGCVLVGNRLDMEFDRVLMGVYICWVPQSVFAITIVLLWSCLGKSDLAK